jgi:GNAT superfamily N-acetyltransferase
VSALVRAWASGWVVLHGSPPTVAEPWGLRIEVGAPGHLIRHVLLDADDAAIRALAGAVTVPTTSIKAFMESADLGRLLTPEWTPDPPGCLMATALRPAAARIAGDYRVTVEHARGITCARVITADGAIAASGQVAVTGETCVFDQIETAPTHRRRGLGSAVMAALTTSATDQGAATGILNATAQGRALYEALSWTVIGPLSSFVYQRPSATNGQG